MTNPPHFQAGVIKSYEKVLKNTYKYLEISYIFITFVIANENRRYDTEQNHTGSPQYD